MKNGEVKIFVICTVVFSVATGIGVTMMQKGYAWSTHMTLHNLADNASQLTLALADSTCTAQVNSNCEAGAEYVWYTIDVYTSPKAQQTPHCVIEKQLPICTYPHVIQKLGVYGHCDVYVTGSNGKYDVSHHCTAADAAGLKPPQNQTK
ncbi:MAG: hypothetical protein WCE96_02035 [Nitrososphaeraceae archaeon]